jgi:hypothetical protein
MTFYIFANTICEASAILLGVSRAEDFASVPETEMAQGIADLCNELLGDGVFASEAKALHAKRTGRYIPSPSYSPVIAITPEAVAHQITLMAAEEKRKKALVASIRVGDRVRIVNRFGQESAGRAVMLGDYGWVLNMGGKHGTPGSVDERNIVRVTRGR